MSTWEKVARAANEECGSYIDWEDRFFICPECGEPIYECDWKNSDFIGKDGDFIGEGWICPVCEEEIAERS